MPPDFAKWFENDAEHLRYEYDLKPNSMVIDVGVYKGEFIKKIVEKYNCFVIGFEPVSEYFCQAVNNLKENKKVKIYNFGLGKETRQEYISVDKDRSSICINNQNCQKEQITIRSFIEVISLYSILSVDLIKINIEGCEYELLESIIENDLQRLFKNIQVQFHDFIPNAYQKRSKILEYLLETHCPTYCYPFVWENYKLNR